MQRLAAVFALGLASACASGSIEGRIVVAEGYGGLAVMAVLFEARPTIGPDGVEREALLFLGQRNVDTAPPNGGAFRYSFDRLSAGTYVVGAYVDRHADRTITDDENTIDDLAPIVVDPSDPERRSFERDIHVGLSAPDKVTLSGTVHLSERARGLRSTLYVLDGGIDDPQARVLRHVPLPPGAEVPFTLHNFPEGPAHLLAIADVGNDGDFANDLVAISAQNPVLIDPARHRIIEGLEIWLDTQAPHLGSMSGDIVLNGIVTGHELQLVVFDTDPTTDAGARTLALLNPTSRSEARLSFSIPSLPLGARYLVAFHGVRENGRTLSTWRAWPGGGEEPGAIRLTEDAPHRESLEFPLGVGRISGQLELDRVPMAVRQLAITASAAGVIHQFDVVPRAPVDGRITSTFEMFGLEDGTFDVQLIPEASGDGRFEDEVAAGYVFRCLPRSVTIVGGERVGCDFRASLGATQ